MRKSLFLAICIFKVLSGVSAQDKTGFIKAGNFNVYYEASGKGEPVFFLHAGLQDHSMWDNQVRELSGKFRVITIDLPYHGSTTGHDTSLYAKEVIRIVQDSLGIKRSSIVGLSMGAAITQDFVISYPERVDKVVLMASGLNGIEKLYQLDTITKTYIAAFFSALQRKDTARAAFEFARSWGDGSKGCDTLVKPSSKAVYVTSLNTLLKHKLISWPRLVNDPPAIDRLNEIRRPVLIIHGEEDLPVIETASKHLQKSINGSVRMQVEDAAHMINLERSDLINNLLTEFLRK